MPHYNWRRRPSSSSGTASSDNDAPPRPFHRSSSSDTTSDSIESKTKSTPTAADRFSTLLVLSSVCSACDLPFDEITEARKPRFLPCLHTFCTACLQNVYDFLEKLASNSKPSTPASRYSWRDRQSRSSSPAPKSILGHFVCPSCHGITSVYNGGRDTVKSTFPLDLLALANVHDGGSTRVESNK